MVGENTTLPNVKFEVLAEGARRYVRVDDSHVFFNMNLLSSSTMRGNSKLAMHSIGLARASTRHPITGPALRVPRTHAQPSPSHLYHGAHVRLAHLLEFLVRGVVVLEIYFGVVGVDDHGSVSRSHLRGRTAERFGVAERRACSIPSQVQNIYKWNCPVRVIPDLELPTEQGSRRLPHHQRESEIER